MQLFINDGHYQLSNVTLLSDFRARRAGPRDALRVGASAPPLPVPDDGEDDEIPNDSPER